MNPIVLTTAGQTIDSEMRIIALVWEGATTIGDTVEVLHKNGSLLWAGRTDSTETYLGLSLGPRGIFSHGGLELKQISAGRVLVYVLES